MAWGAYRMTPARRAAILKAQAASAKKRKGTGKKKKRSPSVRQRVNNDIKTAKSIGKGALKSKKSSARRKKR